MDRTVFYSREKLLATDVNQSSSDSETYGEEIITKLVYGQNTSSAAIFGYDGYVFGILGTLGGGPNYNRIDVSYGLGYQKDGKKIYVPDAGSGTGFQVLWDNIQGMYAELAFDRIDAIAIKHVYSNTSAVRYFIDTNPASASYGQTVTLPVIVGQEDSYGVIVIKGTPDVANPAFPTIPAGYILLAYVYVSSFAHNGSNNIRINTATERIGLGQPGHLGTDWDSTIDDDVDNRIYTSGLRWFKNGVFYSEGTTGGGGLITPVVTPFVNIYDYNLVVNSIGTTFNKINIADFNSGTSIFSASTGFNSKPYTLSIRGE